MKYERYITVADKSSNNSAFSIIKTVIQKEQILITATFSKKIHDRDLENIIENPSELNIIANYHTTRHRIFFHNAIYENGKPFKNYYKEESCEDLCNLKTFEVIGCFRVSPWISENMIFKLYEKSPKKIIAEFDTIDHNYFIYIVVSPLNTDEIDQKCVACNLLYRFETYKFCENYSLKLYYIFEKTNRIGGPKLINCTGMYRKLTSQKENNYFILMTEL